MALDFRAMFDFWDTFCKKLKTFRNSEGKEEHRWCRSGSTFFADTVRKVRLLNKFPKLSHPKHVVTQVISRRPKDFFSKPKSMVGLDIGSFAIKVVEIHEVSGEFELVNFGVERLSQEVSEDIKKVLEHSNITAKRVNTSVSGPSVIVRHIQLPKMTSDELQGAVKYEAGKYIPFDLNEVILDCQILEESENKVKVLLVAAKRNFIDEHIAMISQAGLEPRLIDIDSFALINALQVNMPSKGNEATIALLNIGAKITNVDILQDNVSVFTRDVVVAGDDITKAICEGFALDVKSAQDLKCNPHERLEEVYHCIQPVLDNLLSEIRLSFDYYESQFERGVDRVYVSGGTSGLEGLSDFLSKNIGLETTVWNPTNFLRLSPHLSEERLSRVRNQLPIAIGLAMRK